MRNILILMGWALMAVLTFSSGKARTQKHIPFRMAEGLGERDSHRAAAADTQAVILLKNDNYVLPLAQHDSSRLALLTIGKQPVGFEISLQNLHPVDVYTFDPADGFAEAAGLANGLKKAYDKLIISIAAGANESEKGTLLSPPALSLIRQLQEEMRTVAVTFGNPAMLAALCHSPALVSVITQDSSTAGLAAGLLFNKFNPVGRLPITVCKELAYNSGMMSMKQPRNHPETIEPSSVGLDTSVLYLVDSIAENGILNKAYPGCVVLAMKNGKIFYQKAFGTMSYVDLAPVDIHTIYDLASCTKICATTLACMKLYDDGKLKLNGTLGEYLPWLKKTDKEKIKIKDVLLHQAGFIPDFSYAGVLIGKANLADPDVFHLTRDSVYSMHVAENMYMRKNYLDTMNNLIRDSRLGPRQYVYSDIDLQLMGYIVEEITGIPLNEYVSKTFYIPMGMTSSGYRPRERYSLSRIAPTECETEFRLQCLHGDVHDPRAAMFGGVAGHAGLFSNTEDLSAFISLMLNGGTFGGKRFLNAGTITLFTSYQSDISRRGLGFDKPSKDQRVNKRYPYPSKYASPETFGHTGYTGTCVWVDPKYDFGYVFLSNRVNPDGGKNGKLWTMEIQAKIQDVFYTAMRAANK